jgi:hypothetical protein
VRLREGLERTLAWHRQQRKLEQGHAWFAPVPPPTMPPTMPPVTPPLDVEIPLYEVEEVTA